MRTPLKGAHHVAVLLLAVMPLALTVPHTFASDARGNIKSGAVKELSIDKLARGIADRLKRVEEFKFIEEEALKLGVRAYLFGGTAAGYAHYVKWDMQREKGDPRFQKDRFDYDYTNIYRSTQDLDIVIDGNPEQATQLQTALQNKYPHLQGNKTAWEVRLLTQDMGDKQAILNNPDFMNQHTDSNSTGMIEITKPKAGESIVRDVRDWNSKEPYFLKDVHDGMLHYYFSPLHNTTKFAKEGRNPPILSAIRFLTKAFQYELKIRPEDLASIQKIIQDFDPKATAKNDYVANWIEKNGKKLIQNAVNIEYARNTLDQLGLREKLRSIKDNVSTTESLAWWMNKEPLRSHLIGQGTGKTAKELGLDIVAHETSNFLAYESITRAHTGDPNVLISRNDAAGEAAIHGDGFYTKDGREGARGTGLTIRFHLDPHAREGSDFDFVPNEHYVIIRNKAALKVIPESLNIGPVEYFQMLSQGKSGISHSDRGILEKLKRRVATKTSAVSKQELEEIKKIIRAAINTPGENQSHLFDEWFALPASRSSPELSEALLKKAKTSIPLAKYVLSSALWKDRSDWIGPETLKNVTADQKLAHLFLSSPFIQKHPEWIEALIQDGSIDNDIFLKVLTKPYAADHSEWIEALIKREKNDGDLAYYVLSQPYSKDHPEWVKKLIEKGTVDRKIVRDVLSKPHWANHPEWVEHFLEKAKTDNELANDIAETVLSQEHWKTHPEWVERVLDLGTADLPLVEHALKKSHWDNHPEWIERILSKNKSGLDQELVRSVFPNRYEAHRTKWIEALLQKRDLDILANIARYIVGEEKFKDHPEWVKILLDKNNWQLDWTLTQSAFAYKSHWKDHPEFIETLVKRRNSSNESRLTEMLSSSPWKDHPELLRLTGGEPPTTENLRAAFERGESVRATAPQISCVSQQLHQALK
ncbi:MAG: hypothetical protein ACJ763_12490 [Bdellovibrionia bacterium]